MKKLCKGNAKVKNPCKICLQSVNNKTGLQCQGACKRWAHFTCLNYTPGKIQDIKTGILRVLCPCPDCKTTEPKEYLTNPPYICTHQYCPAHQGPQCSSSDCPLTKQKPLPPCEISFDSYQQEYDKSDPPSVNSNQSSQSCFPTSPPPTSGPNPPRSKKNSHSRPHSPQSESRSSSTPRTTPRGIKGSSPSPTSSPRNIAQRVCPKCKDDKEFTQKKSLSCSCLSNDSGLKKKIQTASSESQITAKNYKVLSQALEDMCNTVGQLSLQLKELMCKMIETIQSTSSK